MAELKIAGRGRRSSACQVNSCHQVYILLTALVCHIKDIPGMIRHLLIIRIISNEIHRRSVFRIINGIARFAHEIAVTSCGDIRRIGFKDLFIGIVEHKKTDHIIRFPRSIDRSRHHPIIYDRCKCGFRSLITLRQFSKFTFTSLKNDKQG